MYVHVGQVVAPKSGRLMVQNTPTVHCTVFVDNSVALEIFNMHKMRPQTQHINVHFCNKVANRHMTVKQADLRTAATGGHAHKAMQSGDFSLSLINGPSWVGDYSLMG